jgi:alkanesulfonate monooxygenase SsuD/methylene tetrahydromethanopterin reductase-like flavin-dependent oxidoreductase (luciferase family)
MKKNFGAYREALIEGGHDPADYDIPFMQQVWVGDSDAELQAVAEAALAYYRMVGKVVPGSDEAIASEAEYYKKVRENIELLTLEQTLTHGGNFGSVDYIVDTLGRLATELGVNHYVCWFRIPSLERGIALKAMETFASEVIPQLRDLEPRTAVAAA